MYNMINYTFVKLSILEIAVVTCYNVISNIINGGEDLLEIYNGGL